MINDVQSSNFSMFRTLNVPSGLKRSCDLTARRVR